MASSLVLLGILAFVVLISAYGDSIKQKAVALVNTQVKSKITVGQVSLSIFKRFPKTTLVLNNVSVQDPVEKERFICRGASFFLDFNSIDLLFGEYNLQRIGIDANFVRLKKHPNAWNYVIWQTSDSSTANTNIALQSVDWTIDSLYIKTDDVYASAKSTGELNINPKGISSFFNVQKAKVSYNGHTYVLGSAEANIKNFDADKLLFQSLEWKHGLLTLKASLQNDDRYAVNAKTGNVTALLQFFGENAFNRLNASANVSFMCLAKDVKQIEQIEIISQDFSWPDQYIKSSRVQLRFNELNQWPWASLFFDGQYKGQAFTLKSVANTSKEKSANARSFSLEAQNIRLDSLVPDMEFFGESVYARIWVKQWLDFLDKPDISSLNIDSASLKNLAVNGTAVQQNFSLLGDANITKNALSFGSKTASINGDVAELKLFWPYVLELGQNPLQTSFELNIKASELNIAPWQSPSTEASGKSINTTDEKLIYNIGLQLDAEKLIYSDLVLNNVYVHLRAKPEQISIAQINGDVFDGSLGLNGSYSMATSGFSAEGFLAGISTEKLLKHFNNFNQNYVQHQNFKGSVNARFSLDDVAFWDNQWGKSSVDLHVYDAQLLDLPFLSDIRSALNENKVASIILNQKELFKKLSFINLQEARASVQLQDHTFFVSNATFRSPEINVDAEGQYNSLSDDINFELQFYVKDFFAKSTSENNYYVNDASGSKLRFYLRGKAQAPEVGLLKRNKGEREGLKNLFKNESIQKEENKASTLFVLDKAKSDQKIENQEKTKDKKGWFKKMLEKVAPKSDSTKIEFEVNP